MNHSFIQPFPFPKGKNCSPCRWLRSFRLFVNDVLSRNDDAQRCDDEMIGSVFLTGEFGRQLQKMAFAILPSDLAGYARECELQELVDLLSQSG